MTSTTLVASCAPSFSTCVFETISEKTKQNSTYNLEILSYALCMPSGIRHALEALTPNEMIQKLMEEDPRNFAPFLTFEKEHAPLLAFALCKLTEVLILKYQVQDEAFIDRFLLCISLEDVKEIVGEEAVNKTLSKFEIHTRKDWNNWQEEQSKIIVAFLHSPSLSQTTAEVKQRVHGSLHPFYSTWCSVKDSEEDSFQAEYQCKMTRADGELATVEFPACVAKYTLKYFDFYYHPDLLPTLQQAFHKMLNCYKKLAALGVPVEHLENLSCLVVLGCADWVHFVAVRLRINQESRMAAPIISTNKFVIYKGTYPTCFLLAFSINQQQAIEKCTNSIGAQTCYTLPIADWEEAAIVPRLDCCEPLGKIYIPRVPQVKKSTLSFIQCFPNRVQEIEALKAKGKNLNLQSTTMISITQDDDTAEIVTRICSQLNVEKSRGIASLTNLQRAITYLVKTRSKQNLPQHIPFYLIAYEETEPVQHLSCHEEQIKCVRSIIDAAASIHAVGLVHGNIDSGSIRYNEIKREYSLDLSGAWFLPSLRTGPTSAIQKVPDSAELDRWNIAVQLVRILTGVQFENSPKQRTSNQDLLFACMEAAKISEDVFGWIVELVKMQ